MEEKLEQELHEGSEQMLNRPGVAKAVLQLGVDLSLQTLLMLTLPLGKIAFWFYMY